MPGGSIRAACTELVSTEESYVETLTTIVTVFLRPLTRWAAEEADAAAGALAHAAAQAEAHAATARAEQRPDVVAAEAMAKAALEAKIKAAAYATLWLEPSTIDSRLACR